MTFRTFLSKLRKTPRDWHLTISGNIRRLGNQCPITSLSNRCDEFVDEVSEELGIKYCLKNNIIAAADNDTYGTYRRALLAACGLKEKTGKAVK